MVLFSDNELDLRYSKWCNSKRVALKALSLNSDVKWESSQFHTSLIKFRSEISETHFYMTNTEVEEKIQDMEEQVSEPLSCEEVGSYTLDPSPVYISGTWDLGSWSLLQYWTKFLLLKVSGAVFFFFFSHTNWLSMMEKLSTHKKV